VPNHDRTYFKKKKKKKKKKRGSVEKKHAPAHATKKQAIKHAEED